MALFARGRSRVGRVIDIDLLPQVAPREGPKWLEFLYGEPQWIGVAVSVLLLLLVLPEREASATHFSYTSERVSEAERRASVVIPKEVRDLEVRVAAVSRQLNGLQQVQTRVNDLRLPWSQLAEATRAMAPQSVRLRSFYQEEASDALLFEGAASTEEAVLAYAATLKASSLYDTVAIREITRGPLQAIQPEGSGAQAAPAGAPQSLSAPGPPAVMEPAAQPPGAPAAGGMPVPPVAPAPPAMQPPSQPPLDFTLASSQRTAGDGAGGLHVIRGRVRDKEGLLVPGLSFKVSACCPEWAAYYPLPGHPASDGTFEFFVTAGSFKVEVLNAAAGRAEAATGLRTDDGGPGEFFEWVIEFGRVPGTQVVPVTPVPDLIPGPVAPSKRQAPLPSWLPAAGMNRASDASSAQPVNFLLAATVSDQVRRPQ